MLHPRLEARYEDLVEAWLRYQAVRRAPASLRELADARYSLDLARGAMHELRARLAPELDEVTIADTLAVCPDLDAHSLVLHGLCGCGAPVATAVTA